MDRTIVLSRLLYQLESVVGLAEHAGSLGVLAPLKSCFEDAAALVEQVEVAVPFRLQALAERLLAISAHPQASAMSLRRIASSYHLLARI